MRARTRDARADCAVAAARPDCSEAAAGTEGSEAEGGDDISALFRVVGRYKT